MLVTTVGILAVAGGALVSTALAGVGVASASTWATGFFLSSSLDVTLVYLVY